VGPRASLNGCGKLCPYWDSIPGPSSLSPVAIPTVLPGPLITCTVCLFTLLLGIFHFMTQIEMQSIALERLCFSE
jgi:hypothetical protein